jgi:hypothetical protein
MHIVRRLGVGRRHEMFTIHDVECEPLPKAIGSRNETGDGIVGPVAPSTQPTHENE